MVSKLALLSNLFLAFAALAPSQLGVRLARGEVPQSQSLSHIESRVGVSLPTTFNVQQAGAELTAAPDSGGLFSYVTSTFTVPHPSGDGGEVMMWVGIDTAGCRFSSSAIRAGINVTITQGVISYGAWYQWIPGSIQALSGVSIRSGDSIVVSVITSTSNRNGGGVLVQNLSTPQLVWVELNLTQPLCQQSVAWIVEDPQQNKVPVQLANFTSVTFSHATASGPVETSYGPTQTLTSNLTLFEIVQAQKNLTSVSINGHDLTVSYV